MAGKRVTWKYGDKTYSGTLIGKLKHISTPGPKMVKLRSYEKKFN